MATTNKIWFFRNTIVPHGRTVRVEGDPTAHPDWVRWGHDYRADGSVLRRYPIIRFYGREFRGTLLEATQKDGVICNRSCETAKNPKCTCQCGGKNHGIAHKIEAEKD